MKLIKHYYYPYFYIERFNGSFNLIFFLDNSFYFENEDDIFKTKYLFKKNLKKEQKVIDEGNTIKHVKQINLTNVDNFFIEFFN